MQRAVIYLFPLSSVHSAYRLHAVEDVRGAALLLSINYVHPGVSLVMLQTAFGHSRPPFPPRLHAAQAVREAALLHLVRHPLALP